MKIYFSRFNTLRKYLLISLFACYAIVASAQEVMIQGWVWNYPQKYGFQSYAKNYLGYVPDLQEAGFNYIWLPPLSRAADETNGMGYDIMDYYDLGEYGLGTTRFGTRTDVNNLIAALKAASIHPVADMVYNQRWGGQWEENDMVKNWITSYSQNSINAGDNVYPSDRWRAYIVLGGSSGNGPGTYYFDVRSASLSSNFYGYPYTFQMWTTKTPQALDSLNNSWEFEPNDGGKCGDSSNFYYLGTMKYADIDGAGGCGIDEFRLVLDTSMYNATGDTLYISMTNDNTSGLSGYSDQELFDVYSGPLNQSIASQIVYETATDFTHVASGRGFMDWQNFHPSGIPTNLGGDWDEMLFFYDVDQHQPSTVKTLSEYQEWMFDSVGIEGMRVDAVKNYPYDFAAWMLDSLHFHGHEPGMIVGEYYDGDPGNLVTYINNVNANMAQGDTLKMKLFDFALRFPMQNACNLNIDVRDVFNSGIVNGGGGSRLNSVTWINNHDFRDPGTYVSNNPELAYAYMITNSLIGTPCVFQQDYFGSNYIRGRIKGLMHASKKYTFAADKVNYLDNYNSPLTSYVTSGYVSNALIYEFHNPVTNRVAIAAINFCNCDMDIYQQVDTSYGVAIGDSFTDIFGLSQDLGFDNISTITSNREIHVLLPPRSFTMYVQGGDLADSLISLGDTLAATKPSAVEEVTETTGVLGVFPNPFSNKIHLLVADLKADNLQVAVSDISGRQLFTTKLSNPVNGVVTFEPGIQTAGIYIVKVTANNEAHFYKLIKN